jgi:hypothetical protein
MHGEGWLRPEPSHVPPLPRSLYRPRVVVPAHEAHCVTPWDAVEDSQAGQRCARPALAAAARDLYPLRLRTLPELEKRIAGIGRVIGQPHVRPPHPARRPMRRLWRLSQQIQPELGSLTLNRAEA